jgi:hypothetical protein
MSAVQYFRGIIRRGKARIQQRALLGQGAPGEISRSDWQQSLTDPTAFYQKCFRYFHTQLSTELREHRKYFTQERRGFGEDSFHVMWFLLFREFKPKNFLEIGVYRGQTVSLAALLQCQLGYEGRVIGISPFSSAGDSVSKYITEVNYFEDTLANFAHFSLPKPTLIKAFSTDVQALATIASVQWDCVYIDGNHDYEIARKDWEACSRSVKPGGIIVLDDSGLTTNYKAAAFATAGHPGPSQLAQEIKNNDPTFREILQVGHNRVFQKI